MIIPNINIEGFLQQIKANKTLDNVTAAAAANLNAVGARTATSVWSDGTSFYVQFSDGFKMCGGSGWGQPALNTVLTVYYPLTFTQYPKVAIAWQIPDFPTMNWKCGISGQSYNYIKFQLITLAGNAYFNGFSYLAEGY